MSFKPEQLTRSPYLPDRISGLIKQEIAAGGLVPGSRLPTEVSLAETYGVSRNVVREAIARLRNEGIIEIAARNWSLCLATPAAGLAPRPPRESHCQRPASRAL
ncbi:FadR/GntR family transcriptional regulator [Aestuariivirga sp.]|uniref:FadR/GntR family transcriptional regulator n=1 Tax=Aestuariivirga sp. TaxID=2650926 RepID=UPI0039E42A27